MKNILSINLKSAKLILLSLILFLLFSCKTGEKNTKGSKKDDSIKKILFNTTGGGDIQFEITRLKKDFKINITRYNFKETNKSLILTHSDNDAYNLVMKIFDKKINLTDMTFTSQGETGTWTSAVVYYYNQQEEIIKNLKAWDDLKSLYKFIRENFDQLN